MVRFEWYSSELRCHYQVKADDLGFPGDDMIMRVHRGVCVSYLASSYPISIASELMYPCQLTTVVPLVIAGTSCLVALQVMQM